MDVAEQEKLCPCCGLSLGSIGCGDDHEQIEIETVVYRRVVIRDAELSLAKLHFACQPVLKSLGEHGTGLTLFVDDASIPMDNNYGEKLIRNPAVGRKNYYGSGSQWSGRLAMMMFSIFATLLLWKINPRTWLS